MYIVLGIVFFILGLLMLLYPQAFYRMTESWKHDGGGEPSALYVFSTRFGGVMLLAVGVLCIVVNFLT